MKLLPTASVPTNHPYLDNKYTRWYYSIIESAQNRQITGYTEKHHIIPDCLFIKRSRPGKPGSIAGNPNDPSNLVAITAREHLVCHILLTKMFKTSEQQMKMINALLIMIGNYRYTKKVAMNSRLFEKMRNQLSEKKKGQPSYVRTAATRKKLSLAAKRRTPEGIERSAAAHRGKVVSEETRSKMRIIHSSRVRLPHSEDTRKKISAANAGQVSNVKGLKWYNNGLKSARFAEDPGEGWRMGRQHSTKSASWYNNGSKEKLFQEHPGDGWIKGRLKV
jgi:hypothetical protein